MSDHMHEESHEGHFHGPITTPLIGGKQLPTPGAKNTTTSFKVALDIWIRRFKEAQDHIRGLEAEKDKLTSKLEEALEMMTEEQLEALHARWVGGNDDK